MGVVKMVKNIEDFKIGESAYITTYVTEELVNNIANLSGDRNPVHLDETYAKNTPFGKKIAHGLLCLGMISNVLASKLPGEGTVLLEEKIKYRRPVYIGDTIKCICTIKEKLVDKNKLIISVLCINDYKDTVLEGLVDVKLM